MTNADTPLTTGRQAGGMRRILAAVLLVAGLLAGGYFGWTKMTENSAAGKEVDMQKAEIEECRKNLASFYDAWTRYTKDHKGHEPESYAQLVPKYISDPDKLTCPTAKRWMAKGKNMAAGTLVVGSKIYPVTYGFRVFAASYQIQLRQFGGRTIIVACDAHQEGVYRSVYRRAPKIDTFDPSQRAGLNEAVRITKLIVLHKNGEVDLQADE